METFQLWNLFFLFKYIFPGKFFCSGKKSLLLLPHQLFHLGVNTADCSSSSHTHFILIFISTSSQHNLISASSQSHLHLVLISSSYSPHLHLTFTWAPSLSKPSLISHLNLYTTHSHLILNLSSASSHHFPISSLSLRVAAPPSASCLR